VYFVPGIWGCVNPTFKVVTSNGNAATCVVSNLSCHFIVDLWHTIKGCSKLTLCSWLCAVEYLSLIAPYMLCHVSSLYGVSFASCGTFSVSTSCNPDLWHFALTADLWVTNSHYLCISDSLAMHGAIQICFDWLNDTRNCPVIVMLSRAYYNRVESWLRDRDR